MFLGAVRKSGGRCVDLVAHSEFNSVRLSERRSVGSRSCEGLGRLMQSLRVSM